MAAWTTLAPDATTAPTEHHELPRELADARTVGGQLGRVVRRPRRDDRTNAALIALDVALAVAAVLAFSWVTTEGHPVPWLIGLLLGAWLMSLASARAWTFDGGAASLRSVTRAGSVLGIGCWVAVTVGDVPATSTQLLVLTATLVTAALLPRAVLATSRMFAAPTRVAVAGGAAESAALVEELLRTRRPGWTVTSACVAGDPADAHAGRGPAGQDEVPVWIGPTRVVDAARATGASAVVLVPGPDLAPAAVRRLGWEAHRSGLDVYVATGLLDVAPARARMVTAGALGMVHVRPGGQRAACRRLKHAVERLIALAALVVALPLLVAIAAAVRLDSDGPALFRQSRVGRGGRTFTMYKFRTMVTDAEVRRTALSADNDCDGVLFKLQRDPRVTSLGRFLRRYSLDELPQLLNVVRGDMSLVGPRPALPGEVEQYDADPRHRLTVKPGLTGLWQVSGRSDLSWEEAVRLDLHYVDNWSLGLDVAIVLRTVGAVLGHRGAY